MPSQAAKILRENMKLLKPLTVKLTVKQARAGQDAMGALGATANAAKLNFYAVPFQDFEARFVTAKDSNEQKRVILYLHGGAYTAGSLAYCVGFGSILAIRTNRKVLCVAYRLAPEHPFPAAVDDAERAYAFLLNEGYLPKDIALVGESAGGGLEYALALRLKERGTPLPGAIVAISPWSDLTLSGKTHETNAENDPTLSTENLRESAEMYAGADLENPLVSPVFGNFEGFPPSLIFAGGDELLLDDSRMLCERLCSFGVRCELVVSEGMWHVYPLFSTPESTEALDKIEMFLEREIPKT